MLPYALIGKATVTILAVTGLALTALFTRYILPRLWKRFFDYLSTCFFDESASNESTPTPPLWKIRLAGVFAAIARFKLTKLLATYRDAETIHNNLKPDQQSPDTE